MESGPSPGTHKLGPAAVHLAGFFAFSSTIISLAAIWLHLKNYRKPVLQRFVVRILLMTPIYAVISWLSLLSKAASFYLDIVRDVYEAFVMYSFFHLLINYLGGEREILTMLHGRRPTPHMWPVNLVWTSWDVGDPYNFLFVKRGILQFVFFKPLLAVVIIILRATDSYQEGYISLTSGYFWTSFIYNISVTLCMYCLVIFFMTTKEDLRPYRPVPKFVCVKAVIAFSFWQGLLISLLVYLRVIQDKGEYTADNIGVAIQEWLICFEMVVAAAAHWYAFSHKDYIDDTIQSARMPVGHALRDAFGMRDVWEDSLDTLRGNRFNYRTFEPAEGAVFPEGPARAARVRAGLRYAHGGQVKYWLPQPSPQRSRMSRIPVFQGYRPVGDDTPQREPVEFPDVDQDEELEETYRQSRHLLYGDYNFPNIDPTMPRGKNKDKQRGSETPGGCPRGRWFDREILHGGRESTRSRSEESGIRTPRNGRFAYEQDSTQAIGSSSSRSTPPAGTPRTAANATPPRKDDSPSRRLLRAPPARSVLVEITSDSSARGMFVPGPETIVAASKSPAKIATPQQLPPSPPKSPPQLFVPQTTDQKNLPVKAIIDYNLEEEGGVGKWGEL